MWRCRARIDTLDAPAFGLAFASLECMLTHSHAPTVALHPAKHSITEAMTEGTGAATEAIHRPHIPRQAIAAEARTAWYHMQRAARLLAVELTRSVTGVYRLLRDRLGPMARPHRKAHS